jgi:putative transposase
MKKDLREIYLAPSRALAEVAINVFAEKYQAKHHKAVECLTKDRVGEARNSIGRYLDFYNGRRPHSSLDDATPDQAYFNQPPFRLAA